MIFQLQQQAGFKCDLVREITGITLFSPPRGVTNSSKYLLQFLVLLMMESSDKKFRIDLSISSNELFCPTASKASSANNSRLDFFLVPCFAWMKNLQIIHHYSIVVDLEAMSSTNHNQYYNMETVYHKFARNDSPLYRVRERK